MIKRMVFITSLTFFMLMVGYLVVFPNAGFFHRQMISYLMMLSAVIGVLSYIYVGYTKSAATLAIRTVLHYFLLLAVLALSLVLFIPIPLWPSRIFWLWLIYTILYAIFWIIIFRIGQVQTKDLNERLKEYLKKHND